MANLARVVQQLKNERNQAQRKLEQLDAALKALAGLNSGSGKSNRPNTRAGRRRPMSAAAASALRRHSGRGGQNGRHPNAASS
jgi:hypothetical protein